MNHAALLGSILAVHLLASISPGPNILVVAHTAISRSRRAAIATALGIAAGAAVWSSAALLGLSILFAHFAWLHGALRLLGGIYLLYLGIRLWRLAEEPLAPRSSDCGTPCPDGEAFRLGLLTNLTNPKAVVFYGTILAAFLGPDLPLWVQLAAVGIIVANATAWHIALACLFSNERAQRTYRRIKGGIDRLAGAALALLGLRLLIPDAEQ